MGIDNITSRYIQNPTLFPLFRINRAQLLDDALNLGRADLLDYPTALKVTEYLTLETDFIPWSAAITGSAANRSNRLNNHGEDPY